MEALLQRGTIEYVYGDNNVSGRKMVDVEDVLEAVDQEYKISDRPVTIADATFNEQRSAAKEEKWVYRILSVALFHQIPAPIVGLLLRRPKGGESLLEDDPIQFCRNALERDGWKAVSFPNGFRVQIRPGLICSTWKSYLPTRKVSKERAEELIQEADQTNLPEKIASSPRKELLDTLDKELPNIKRKNKRIPQLQDNLPYFPKKSKWKSLVQGFRRIMQKQVQMLNKAGRAGAIAYGFLNFALYAGGTIWQWNRVSVLPGGGLNVQLKRLGRVLGTVYIGSQVTKLPRIALAAALAPLGDKILIFLQEKFGVAENTAFAILTVGLIASFVGILALMTIGSTVLASV
jgi:hypothetical protein